MPSSFLLLLIGCLGVVMVTSAPLASQEKLVNVEQEAGETVDRAKRAQEEIVFGNQQNKARVMAKKSDLSNVIEPALPEGELDQGAEVIVHKERPVEADLVARAEATAGDGDEKMAEAVEEAMHTVATAEEAQAENNQEAIDATEADQDTAKELATEEIVENNDGTEEIKELAAAEEDEHEEEEEEADLQDLERLGAAQPEANAELAAVEEGSQENPDLQGSNYQYDDVAEILRALEQQKNDYFPTMGGPDMYNPYPSKLPDRYGKPGMLQKLPYLYYRRRRSLAKSQNALTQGNDNKRARRIKRDLLDDGLYSPYSYAVPYAPMETEDPLLEEPDDMVPLTDDEAEYLYNRLVNYLASSDVPDQMSPYQDTPPVDPFLGGYESIPDDPYTPYQLDEGIPEVSSPYDDGYPYQVFDPSAYDAGYRTLEKRGYYDVYPQEEEKRYFFPFNDEPETHWGAFVPEKRDYDEAIQRLQRLAMALSGSPGPYYREMIEQDYRRK